MITVHELSMLKQAYDDVAAMLPDVPNIKVRLDRAYDIVRCNGEGYEVFQVQTDCYQVYKASTSLLEDTSALYELQRANKQWSCTCPDYDKAPSNMCKHRLAVMIVERVVALCR